MSLEELNILKSRSGVYQDTSENRRKHRVGQHYGGSEADVEEEIPALKRGDRITVVGPLGQKVTGKFQETYTDKNGNKFYSVHIKGNDYFAGVSILRNHTREEKAAKRAQEKIEDLEYELRSLDKEEDRIRLDQEQDPEVLAHIEDGNHPAVVHYSDLLEDVAKRRAKVEEKIDTYKKIIDAAGK